jgi:hypothetical protein
MRSLFFCDVMLCSLIVTDVSGQSIISIFKGQATQVFLVWLTLICSLPSLVVSYWRIVITYCSKYAEYLIPEDESDRVFRNVGSLNTYLRCGTFQKTEDAEIYVASTMNMLNILSGTPVLINLSRVMPLYLHYRKYEGQDPDSTKTVCCTCWCPLFIVR